MRENKISKPTRHYAAIILFVLLSLSFLAYLIGSLICLFSFIANDGGDIIILFFVLGTFAIVNFLFLFFIDDFYVTEEKIVRGFCFRKKTIFFKNIKKVVVKKHESSFDVIHKDIHFSDGRTIIKVEINARTIKEIKEALMRIKETTGLMFEMEKTRDYQDTMSYNDFDDN